MHRGWLPAIILWISCCGVLLGADGVVLHSKTSASGPKGIFRNEIRKTCYVPTAVRDTSEQDDLIILFDARKIISINHPNKTYTEFSFDEMQDALDSLDDPDQQKEAAEAMRELMGDVNRISLARLGEAETIAGYKTERYLLKMPPAIEMEIWSAPDLRLPAIYHESMKLRSPHNPGFDMNKLLEVMKSVNGVAVKTVTSVNLMGAIVKSITEVTSVEHVDLPNSLFEIPAGYQHVQQD